MTQVYIPRYRLVDEPPEKPHYVYIVEVLIAGRHHCVEKRYSAFHCLHRELRKHYNTPDFPPKRVRSCAKVLERRKHTLEQYLQAMLRFGPSRDQVLAFLGIDRNQSSSESLDAVINKPLDHKPIYNFKDDPYLEINRNCSLPDIVTQGVLMALYEKTQ